MIHDLSSLGRDGSCGCIAGNSGSVSVLFALLVSWAVEVVLSRQTVLFNTLVVDKTELMVV